MTLLDEIEQLEKIAYGTRFNQKPSKPQLPMKPMKPKVNKHNNAPRNTLYKPKLVHKNVLPDIGEEIDEAIALIDHPAAKPYVKPK